MTSPQILTYSTWLALFIFIVFSSVRIKGYLTYQLFVNGVLSGSIQMIKKAIKIGADIHYEDDSALIYASSKGDLEVVKCLVEQGADIHARNDKALVDATATNHMHICHYLVSQGSDPQKVIDNTDLGEGDKQWAIDFVRARDFSNKLESELKPKKETKSGRIKI